jgi:hypothetical protein
LEADKVRIMILMKRRHFLHALAASSILPQALSARERRGGKWTKEAIIRYSMYLVDWAKADLKKRAATLKQLADIEAPLDFKFFSGSLDKKDEAFHQRFLAARLSDKDTTAHISGLLKDVEAVRAFIATKEAEAVPKWKNDQEGDLPLKEGKIFDSSISSRKLGVILDNSNSMTPYLDKLRTEIERDFASCHIVEVDGCELPAGQGRGQIPWFYSAPAVGINPFTPDRHCPGIPQTEAHHFWANWTTDAPSAFVAMTNLMSVDAIYWFCDFDDPIADAEVAILGKAILEKKIKLFVHTLSKNPPKLLAALVERSEGKVIKKRLK